MSAVRSQDTFCTLSRRVQRTRGLQRPERAARAGIACKKCPGSVLHAGGSAPEADRPTWVDVLDDRLIAAVVEIGELESDHLLGTDERAVVAGELDRGALGGPRPEEHGARVEERHGPRMERGRNPREACRAG